MRTVRATPKKRPPCTFPDLRREPSKNEMLTPPKCRFGLHIGLNSISYVKVERKAGDWYVSDCGDVPWSFGNLNAENCEDELQSELQRIVKDLSIHQESAHLSLHGRYCVTRLATGSRKQVDEQLAEIVDNGQHYLQLGLGDKLIGSSIDAIDAQHHYGYVAIMKRGLIEALEDAVGQAGLELEAVDGALTSACRLVGQSGLDAAAPLLLVWLGPDGAEIGISYRGRMQLNYHAGTSGTVEQTAQKVQKHLKRLKRFCDRYRQVDGSAELSRVLVLANPQDAQALQGRLAQLDFEQVFTLGDLSERPEIHQRLQMQPIASAGVASALGGLLVHLEEGILPATDLYERYLLSKPRSLASVVFRDCWSSLVAAAVLIAVLVCGWWWRHEIDVLDLEVAMLAETFDEEHDQLAELEASQALLQEYKRLQHTVFQHPIEDIVSAVATCLPADARIDWFGIDSQDRLVLKGTMLDGDRSYEILKALRDLPAIQEVALESVGRSTHFGQSATFFEIHCELAGKLSNSTSDKVASIDATGGSR